MGQIHVFVEKWTAESNIGENTVGIVNHIADERFQRMRREEEFSLIHVHAVWDGKMEGFERDR